jgi:kynurenine 3-monooxygenase
MLADENGNYLLEPQSVHLWPRGNYLMMGQPNLNGSFSLTLILPSEGKVTF